MQFVNYGLGKEAWDHLQSAYKKEMDENPICKLCNRNPTERVTPFGTIKACCWDCCRKIWQEMNDEMESQRKFDEEYY